MISFIFGSSTDDYFIHIKIDFWLIANKLIKVAIIQEVVANYRAAFLNSLGDQVSLTVYHSDPTPAKKIETIDNNARRSFNSIKVKSFHFFGGVLAYHPEIIRNLKAERPDVIIIESRIGLLTSWVIALKYKRNHNVIGWLSGHEPIESKWKKKVRFLIRKWMLKLCHAYICYGSGGSDYLKQMEITENIFIAYNSIDTEEINKAIQYISQDPAWPDIRLSIRNTANLVIIYSGRIQSNKKIELILYALANLINTKGITDLRFICIGGGVYLEILRSYSKDLKIEEKVIFTGPIYDESDLAQYFLASDIFVLPGKGGLAINQAIAYGLPVVLSKADGTEKDMVINNKNGLYFQYGDSDDLADKILYLYNNKELISKFSELSVEISSTKCNIDNMINGFMQAIHLITYGI